MTKRFSASRLSTWMDCPLQAKFQYVDRLPRPTNAYAVFGSCVHHALEIYNNTRNVEQAEAIFVDVWTNPEKIGRPVDTWPPRVTFGGFMQKGREAIRNYHEQLKWGQRTVVAAEHRFLVPFGEYELTGVVDVLELTKDKKGHMGLHIVDYKTNGKAPYLNALRLNIQFTIYDFASRQPEFWLGNGDEFPPMMNGEWYWEQVQGLPRKGYWYGLMQQKAYDVGLRDDEDYMRLYRVCREIDKAIEADVYVPNVSGDSCGFCPYIEPCGLPINPRTYDPEAEDD